MNRLIRLHHALISKKHLRKAFRLERFLDNITLLFKIK